MHNSADTGCFGSFDKRFRILYGLIKGDLSVREANPVGVVQGGGSLQAFPQLAGVVEAEWGNAYDIAEEVFVVGVSGEGFNPFSHREKTPGYIFAGVAEGSGNYV